MRFLVPTLFVVSTQAFAATPIDKMKGTIGSVNMDADRVDVPLFSSANGYPFPSVQVTIGEHQYLFKIDTASTGLYVSPRVVKNHDLKVRVGNKKWINLQGESGEYKVGGEQKYAEIGEIRIGELVLQDVVGATKKSPSSPLGHRNGPRGVHANFYDGVIGLGALPADVSWAIRPSDGQVTFARGEAVSGLTSGGVVVPFTRKDSYKYQYGTKKAIESARTLIVDANIGGTVRQTMLSTALVDGVYYTEEPTPAAVNGRVGDVHTRHHAISVADTSLGNTWMSELKALPEQPVAAQAVLGTKVLHRYDIVADRVRGTVTLNPTAEGQWNDPREFLLVEALKAVEPTAESGEADGEEQSASGEAEAKAKPPGDAAKWTALKDLYLISGDLEKSIEAMENVLAFDEKDCAARITLGKLQLQAGDATAAKASFENASAAYHAWFSRPLDEREELKEAFDKLDKDEKAASEFFPVGAGCYVADGLLAEAVFALGDLKAVQALYAERFDLDQGLALLAANALISEGAFARAQEPLRQTLKSPGRHSHARFALAMSYAGSGDWAQASVLFDRSLDFFQPSQAVKVWIDAYTAAEGWDAARSAVVTYAAQKPERLSSQFGLAYVLRDSQDEAARENAQNQGEVAFQQALTEMPRSGYVWAEYARWLNLWGETDKAEAAAQKALSTEPGSPGVATALMALSEIYAARSNATLAKQYALKAVQAEPRHPGYAPLIRGMAQ